MPITSMYYREWAETYDEFSAVAGVAAELGLRTYLGPCYMSGMSYWQAAGDARAHHWQEARGLAGLEAAVRFSVNFDGAHDGLIRGALLPDHIQTHTLGSAAAHCGAEPGNSTRRCVCTAARGSARWRWSNNCAVFAAGLVAAIGPADPPRSLLPPTASTPQAMTSLQRVVDGGASLVHCPVVFWPVTARR